MQEPAIKVMPRKSQVDSLLEELYGLSDDDIRQYGVTLTLDRRWYIRFTWTPAEDVDTTPIRHLLTARIDLFNNLIDSNGLNEIVPRLRDIHAWIYPRGYNVGISGMNIWSRMRLHLFAWGGGFRKG